MITRISKISHRTFRDFRWPENLPPFARYNLIYGWNGSGKTTLSNLFQVIEKRQRLEGGSCVMECESGQIQLEDIAVTTQLPQMYVSSTGPSWKTMCLPLEIR